MLFAVSIPEVLFIIYGWAVPVVILAALCGFRWKAGMWGNLLSLATVMFAFLIAAGWWEDLAFLLATKVPAMLFFADCIAFWTIFVVALLILDIATRFASSVKVKYADTVESVGNGVALFLLFAAVYGTFLFAEDLSPVGEYHNAPQQGDSITIQVLRILSGGNLSGFTQVTRFDNDGKFRSLHLQRKQALMLNMLGENGSPQGSESQADKLKRRE